jgi:hypothetical protein
MPFISTKFDAQSYHSGIAQAWHGLPQPLRTIVGTGSQLFAFRCAMNEVMSFIIDYK